MNGILRTGMVLCVALMLAGCGNKGSSGYKRQSQGAPYEIVVVADHAQWDGAVGDTLRAMFYEQYPMINRQETMFDVLRVLPEGFKRLITRHRNILMLNVGEQFATPQLELHFDMFAAPQMVLVANAPDNASMVALLDSHRDDMMMMLEKAERDRDLANAREFGPQPIKELIKNKFGFEMDVTPGFTVRSDKENFLWMSYEMPTSSQGVIVYAYPFSGLKDFERERLIARRNEFAGLIPGENPGSHMSTNPEFVELLFKQINGRSWSEMHGFWDVTGDFMGGPYTNYSTIDAANQRVIAIDFYVYSPGSTNTRLSQRNYIKQLEHFIYSVKIPGPGETAGSAPAVPEPAPAGTE